MSNNTPSKKRREGREAFAPELNPDDYNSYKSPWDRGNWLEGWNQERSNYEELEKEKQDEDWLALSCCCPWNNNDICIAVGGNACRDDNCAIYYFRNKL